MNQGFKKYLLLLLIPILWYSLFLLQKINLTTADLGRHLKNGELILRGEPEVFFKNFYSYTHPDYPFYNHHWLSGAIFFAVQEVTGFIGLHLFFVLTALTSLGIFLFVAEQKASTASVVLTALFLVPLVAQRLEVRPEAFSYLFSGFFFLILTLVEKEKIGKRTMFLLPALEIIWVNLHSLFVLGPCIVTAFLAQELVGGKGAGEKKRKELMLILMLTLGATLLNPGGVKGTLYLLTMARDYGYRIVENQSVLFLHRLKFFKSPNLALFKIAASLVLICLIWAWIERGWRTDVSDSILLVGALASAFFALRNFTLFGLFSISILPRLVKDVFPGIKIGAEDTAFAPLIIGVMIFTHYTILPFEAGEMGLGLMPEVNGSARFFMENEIEGPVFNNYDMGSYLVYHLYPEQKVFVDNRPEAYPSSFFKDVYIPMQNDASEWQQQLQKWDFNTIFFMRHDMTPWAQNFLKQRVGDPEWAPVFVDAYSIIFVKRNEKNQPIIAQHELSLPSQ